MTPTLESLGIDKLSLEEKLELAGTLEEAIKAEQAERDWDEQIERDERAGKLDGLIDRALEEHRAGRTRPL